MFTFKSKLNQSHINDGSLRVDQSIVNQFAANPDNPYLISFPRTGSHWLRMMLELYFEQPTLVRAFYYPEKENYLLCHHHDVTLDVERKNVIYLYREPVATIYSQLRYEQDPLDDTQRIVYWSDVYAQHLDKWLIQESFTTKKTIITYEGLKNDIDTTFAKITAHFDVPFDADKLAVASEQVTKGEVKSKTQHDEQVVQLDNRYAMSRDAFRDQSTQLILDTIFKNRDQMRPFFEGIIE